MGWAKKVGAAVKKPFSRGGAEAEFDKYGPKVVGKSTYEGWKNSPLGGKYAKILTDAVIGKKKDAQKSAAALEQLKKSWVDYSGATDSGGNLLDQYKLGGADTWLKAQLGANELNRGQNMDLASKNTLSGLAQQQSGLAMTGGLSSGARERLARSGARDLNLSRQGVGLQSDLAKFGLESDAFEKNQAANQFNIQNQLADMKAKEEAKQAKYAADMQAWAAGEQAKATAKSGKK